MLSAETLDVSDPTLVRSIVVDAIAMVRTTADKRGIDVRFLDKLDIERCMSHSVTVVSTMYGIDGILGNPHMTNDGCITMINSLYDTMVIRMSFEDTVASNNQHVLNFASEVYLRAGINLFNLD